MMVGSLVEMDITLISAIWTLIELEGLLLG